MTQEILSKPRYTVTLTDPAAEKVTKLLDREEPGMALRISVQPGGCSGMRYQLYFTDQYAKVLAKDLAERVDEGYADADDEETAVERVAMISAAESVVWFERFAVLVDKLSGPYLNGANIDFTDTMEKQGFTIDNPNAQGACGCGDSFR